MYADEGQSITFVCPDDRIESQIMEAGRLPKNFAVLKLIAKQSGVSKLDSLIVGRARTTVCRKQRNERATLRYCSEASGNKGLKSHWLNRYWITRTQNNRRDSMTTCYSPRLTKSILTSYRPKAPKTGRTSDLLSVYKGRIIGVPKRSLSVKFQKA